MLPAKFQVNWLLGLGEDAKKDFQDGHHGCHLGFLISTILAIFDLQVTLMLPTKFVVNWPFHSGDEVKNRFSRRRQGGHLGFPIGTILAIFDLQVTLMLPTKFQVNWHLGFGEAKNSFSRWPPWWPFWIYNRHDFNYF